MTGRFLTVVVFAFTATLGAQQEIDYRLTLPEIATRQAPEPFLRSRIRELLPQSLEEMVPKADLIVHGTVELRNTYLSADQRDLYTDYLVTPLRVFAQRTPQVATAPGAPLPIVLKRWGGQTVLNGVSVTVEDRDLRQFRSGDELVLVLVYDSADGKYQLAGDISGAFSVSRGQILPLVSHPIAESLRNTSIAQFESEVRRLRPN